MILVRVEGEHQIWWQVLTGNSNFWFDNWTKQGALYYIEGNHAEEEEIEVREFINQGNWDIPKLRSKLSEEMIKHIVETIKPPTEGRKDDKPWWMANTKEVFYVKSVWELVRKRDEPTQCYELMWIKRVSFKINFFYWRVWRRRISTDDNLKRMKITSVSRCHSCDTYEEETMCHLLLTSPTANKLWKQFAIFAEAHRAIKIEECLQSNTLINNVDTMEEKKCQKT
ncbi:hypothetical protein KY290_017469 [Solanum tuberosum]|uniref:Reverse transcriptase zinc-binding domain-containing protein n=1 Tax=Solanum tuberosum TaxID=4113 RepID=A0ABQ7VBH3_SOLTU|nr:hypothetical protein KY290_017469 [Solanum tuberosum]